MREKVGINSNFKNLIKFPKLGGRWTNTREGGLDVYAVILQPEKIEDNYSKCLTGTPNWGVIDVVLSPDKYKILNKKLFDEETINYSPSSVPVNLAMLIGTTKITFWDGNFYFTAKMNDLTDYGKDLFDIIKWSYGRYPDIVTLLDT
jgi:hypothetical protein